MKFKRMMKFVDKSFIVVLAGALVLAIMEGNVFTIGVLGALFISELRIANLKNFIFHEDNRKK